MNPFQTIYLHITKQCNLNCTYCYFDAGQPMDTELTTHELLSVLSDSVALKPEKIVFTGGEPLFRKDLIRLARSLKKTRSYSKVCLSTNGTLITQQNAEDLVSNFDEIRISIDGFEDEHDSLRGDGTFRKTMMAFNHILHSGGDPIAFITVCSLNFPILKDFMQYLLSCRINKIHVSPLKEAGRADDSNQLCDFFKIQELVEAFWFETFGLPMMREKNRANNCGVGRFLTVYPDGSVYPCHLLAFPEFRLGNVRKMDLSSIINRSGLTDELRSLKFRDIARCKECFSNLTHESSCLGLTVQDKSARNQLKCFLKR